MATDTTYCNIWIVYGAEGKIGIYMLNIGIRIHTDFQSKAEVSN